MKHSYYLFITLLLVLWKMSILVAQTNEKGKKKYRKIKQEMKEFYYDIEKWEKFKESMETAKAKADSLERELKRVKQQEKSTEENLQALRNQQNKQQGIIQELEQKAVLPPEKNEIPDNGVFFSIQIGAYYYKDLKHLINENSLDLNIEFSDSGLKKYLLGSYPNYEDAAKARMRLRKMGFKDAWIVAYKNKERVSMTEVRKTPISEKELKRLQGIKD